MTLLHILYTGNLHGEMALLPRLYTFIEQVEHERGIQTLRLDLGHACAPEVWHCKATDGRSVVVALDGMGFHAAHITGMSADSRQKLQDTVNMGLVDAQHAWRYDVPPVRDDGIIVSSVPTPALILCIVVSPAKKTELADKTLFLQAVEAGQIGLVSVDISPEPALRWHEILTVPPDTRPDATITAAVQFVEDEARFYAKKSGMM